MKKILLTTIAVTSLISTAYAADTAKTAACNASPIAELNTNYGVIDIQLNKTKAPVTVANFTQYVTSGFYNGKIFHRVIPGFMIQGGGFDKNMTEAQN